ncbi:MAG TPA: endonuclease III [Candidatus Deferrimicrobium sp.]|nr:endonuclease III [Candidatus Deferrimicrobium sp.]
MASEILKLIAKEMDVSQHIQSWELHSPFETLIRTILSQNTTDRTSFVAFDNLKAKFNNNIAPEILAEADQGAIQEEIRIAGLHFQKSKRIKEVSQIILKDWNSDFTFIYDDPLEEARKKLISLPGIGQKTADIVLNFCAKRPILPVDTHITRIAKRIGIVPENAKYDEIRESIEALISPEEILFVHVSLIFFGRKVCKAVNPSCPTCPVTHLCPKIGVGKPKKSKKLKKVKKTK